MYMYMYVKSILSDFNSSKIFKTYFSLDAHVTVFLDHIYRKMSDATWLRRVVIVIAVMMLFLTSWLYRPLPPGYTQPALTQLAMMSTKLLMDTVSGVLLSVLLWKIVKMCVLGCSKYNNIYS